MRSMRPQAVTNRENAQHSTGPKTAAGKDTARRNALWHGLCAGQLLLAGEDQAAFASLREDLHRELDPHTRLETEAIERLVMLHWVCRRGTVIEQQLFARGLTGSVHTPAITTQTLAQSEIIPGDLQPAAAAAAGSGSGSAEVAGSAAAAEAAEIETSPATAATTAATALVDAIAADLHLFSLIMRYIHGNLRLLERELKMYFDLKARAHAAPAGGAPYALPPTPPSHTQATRAPNTPAEKTLRFDDDGNPLPVDTDFDHVDWAQAVQELYWGVSAGPQHGHPLPATYYCAYAIWLKQKLMIDHDIGDDEAASLLTAYAVVSGMQAARVMPIAGTAWGAPDDIAQWKEAAKTDDPYPAWCRLIQRDYARRDGGTVADAAAKLRDLGPTYHIDDLPGPWQASGDMGQKDRADGGRS